MALTHPHYLIQKAAEAYENYRLAGSYGERQYWLGRAEGYQAVYVATFEGVDKRTERIAHYVFELQKTYDAAASIANYMEYGES